VGLDPSEIELLSLLLSHKMPNSRSAGISLSSSSSSMKALRKHGVKSIDEVKEILNSLERKGIIRLEEFKAPAKKRVVTDLEGGEKDRQLEELNTRYALKEIDAKQYEEKFYKLFSHAESSEIKAFIPLTLLETYLYLLKRFFHILSFIQPSREARFENLRSLIEKNVSQISGEIIKILREYAEAVKERADKKQDATIVFVNLYPFLKDLIEGASLFQVKNQKEIAAEIENVKASINVEREIINVLRMLKENEQKINAHVHRLQTLENRLRELESQIQVKNLTMRFSREIVDINLIRNKLLMSFGEVPPICRPMVMGLVEDLAGLLHNVLSKEVHRGKGAEYYEVNLGKMIMESEEIKEDRCTIKVSLIWVNESCPVTLDSIIESDGKELTMCKNPECFVVYHKKCLEVLLQTGVDKCLVCGHPII